MAITTKSFAEFHLEFEDETPIPNKYSSSRSKSQKRKIAQVEPDIVVIEDSPPSTPRPAIKKLRKQVQTDNCAVISRDSTSEEVLRAIQLVGIPERANVKTEINKADLTSSTSCDPKLSSVWQWSDVTGDPSFEDTSLRKLLHRN